jgi:hypothetical protein
MGIMPLEDNQTPMFLFPTTNNVANAGTSEAGQKAATYW